jgi:hypothetical protein
MEMKGKPGNQKENKKFTTSQLRSPAKHRGK